ncbi:unnamed protein product [Victoria cruziana]
MEKTNSPPLCALDLIFLFLQQSTSIIFHRPKPDFMEKSGQELIFSTKSSSPIHFGQELVWMDFFLACSTLSLVHSVDPHLAAHIFFILQVEDEEFLLQMTRFVVEYLPLRRACLLRTAS